MKHIEPSGRLCAPRASCAGMLNGGVVTLGLPLLNCFLNDNGTALADGAPMPVRFGTWFWGLGMNSSVFVPKTVGANYDLPEELSALRTGARPHQCVYQLQRLSGTPRRTCATTRGWVIIQRPARRRSAPRIGRARRLDVSDLTRTSAARTRFQTLTATANRRRAHQLQLRERQFPQRRRSVAAQLLQQLFGGDFQDPNAHAFHAEPAGHGAQERAVRRARPRPRSSRSMVGARTGRASNSTSPALRDLERQFDQQLTKPEPIASCHVPGAAAEEDPRPAMDTGWSPCGTS